MLVKLLSWNVNGIRAAQKSGLLSWMEAQDPDVLCIQEAKAFPEQLDEVLLHPPGYHSYWNPAQKPGYSGVALYSKKEPLGLTLGLGHPEIDAEGRVMTADYGSFVLMNAYFPNSQRDHARLGFKLLFCQEMLQACERLRSQGKTVIICGDFNIAHKEIDLKNPRANQNQAGFLPEERAWMDQFVGRGYVDAFRKFVSAPDHYTWWSYRPGVRDKNIGWRLDYFFINPESQDRLSHAFHQPQVRGSDHCPVGFQWKD
ncbi:MAG: exodeoxyribonuclease III [Bdellovibrionia bacterium]